MASYKTMHEVVWSFLRDLDVVRNKSEVGTNEKAQNRNELGGMVS